eukprot:s253_g29.t1
MESLRYSKTFIDVEDTHESSSLRTCSAPPVMGQCSQNAPNRFVLHQYEQRRINLQVSNLQLGTQLAGENSVITSQVDLSRGSYGHPQVCARPCILFLRDACWKGDKCGFCHLPHESKSRSGFLDKQQRDYLKQLPKVTFLKMLLPFVAERVKGSELDAAVVLQLLKSEISVRCSTSPTLTAQTAPTAPTATIVQTPGRIRQVLQRMSLAGLVSTACKILPQDRFPKLMKNELQRLRKAIRAFDLDTLG